MEVTHNQVVGFHAHRIILNANAVSRRGLAGNGHVGLVELEAAGEFDQAADVENDGSWPGGEFHAVAERAGNSRAGAVLILKIRDVIDISASSTFGPGAGAFCARKSADGCGGGGASRANGSDGEDEKQRR